MTKPMQERNKQEDSAVISSEIPGNSAPAVSSASSLDSGLQTDDSSLSSPESTAISTLSSKAEPVSCSTDPLYSRSVFVPTLSSSSCYTDTSISSQLERELLADSSVSLHTGNEPTTYCSISSQMERERLAVASMGTIVEDDILAHTSNSTLLVGELLAETSIGSLKKNQLLASFSILLQRQLLEDASTSLQLENELLAHASISSHSERELLADASISSQLEKELLADAFISSHTEREILAEASLSSHAEREILADASISSQLEKEFLADAFISSYVEREILAEASLSSHAERDVLADALISSHAERELIADASISSHAERELLADSSISLHAERDLLADACISSHAKRELIADASISSHAEREIPAEASLSSHAERELLADSSISSHAERDLLADASISSHAKRELIADASISSHAERELLADASLSSQMVNELPAGTSSDDQSPDVQLYANAQGLNNKDQVCEKDLGVSSASGIGEEKRPERILYLSAFNWDRFSLEHPSDVSVDEEAELESWMYCLGISPPDGESEEIERLLGSSHLNREPHMPERNLRRLNEESMFLEHLTDSGRGKGKQVKPRSCLESSSAEKDKSVNVYLHTSGIQNGVYVPWSVYYEPIPSTSTGITRFGIIDPTHGPSERDSVKDSSRGKKKGAQIKRSRSSLDSNSKKRSAPAKTNKLKKDNSLSQSNKPRAPSSSCKKAKTEPSPSPVITGPTQSSASENVNTVNMDRSLSPIRRLPTQRPHQGDVDMSRMDVSRSPVIRQAKQSSPRRKAFMRRLDRSRRQQNRRPRPSLYRRIRKQSAGRGRRPLRRDPSTRRSSDYPAFHRSDDCEYQVPSSSETDPTPRNSTGRARGRELRRDTPQPIGPDIQESTRRPRPDNIDAVPLAVGKTEKDKPDHGIKPSEQEPKPSTSTGIMFSQGSSRTSSSLNTASAIQDGAEEVSPCTKDTLTSGGVDDTSKEKRDAGPKSSEDEPTPSTSTDITHGRGFEKPPIPFDIVVEIRDNTCQSRPKCSNDSLPPTVDNKDELEHDKASNWESDLWCNNRISKTNIREEADNLKLRKSYREPSPLCIEPSPRFKRRKGSRIGERRRRSRSRGRKSRQKPENGKRRRSSSSSDREVYSSSSHVNLREAGSSGSDEEDLRHESKRGKRRRRSRSYRREAHGSSSHVNVKEARSSNSDDTKSRPTQKRRTYGKRRRRSSSSPDGNSSGSSSSDSDSRRRKKKRKARRLNEDGSYICSNDCPCKGSGTGKTRRKIKRRFRVAEDLYSRFLRSRCMDPAKQPEERCCERNCCGQWTAKMVNSVDLLKEYI